MSTQLLWIAAFVGSMILMSLNYKKRKKKVMFIGNAFAELSLMQARYIVQLKDLLKKENVDDKYEIINVGLSATFLDEVFEKIEAAVLDKGPEILIFNPDVLESIDWFTTGRKELEAFYKSLVKRMQESKINVIMLAPSVASNERAELEQRAIEFGEYYTSMKGIANKNQLPFVEVLAETNEVADAMVAAELWKALKLFK